ncbi:O-methyltransferase domain-containing protein 4 [Elsinoe fawcettii]|nr:O-methyltransferase domain-containing protein 4 [Elsinoe fawcettii]
MEAIIKQIDEFVATGGEVARRAALEAVQKLSRTLEKPYDTYHRLNALPLEIAAAKIGDNLGLFKVLCESNEPLSLATLATKTAAPEITLIRILRHLAACQMITETSRQTYTSNPITHHLALPGVHGAIFHIFDNCGPIFQRLPSFLEETSYANPATPTSTAFNAAYSTPDPAFVWAVKEPKRFEAFQAAMTAQTLGQEAWFRVFPFASSLGSFLSASPAPVLVDIGGGVGHQCIALLDAYPELAGRLVLQDLPQSIDMAAPHLPVGVKGEAHDFFTTQPESSRGARFFYLRTILHDWPDEEAVRILRHVADAMGEESEVLIDELVMPEQGAHIHATVYDVVMMCALGGRERTRKEWEVLVAKAGLEVRDVTGYTMPKGDSIIRCGKKRVDG